MINRNGFNYTHYRCLELANGKRTLDQLAELVSLECNIDMVLFREDIEFVFMQLEQAELIVWNGCFPEKVKDGCELFILNFCYPSPAIVYWELTNLCNLSCAHCYISADYDLNDELTTAESFKLIEQVAEIKPYMFEMSGGEAILRKDFFEILSYAKEKLDCKIKLLTNGFAITEEIAAKLEGYIDFIHISLDGLESVHDDFRRRSGSFNKALNAAKLFKEVGIKFGFSMTVFKQSISQIEDVAKLAIKFGAHKMRYFYLYPFGKASNGLPEYSLSKAQMTEAYHKIVEIRNKYSNQIFVDTREGLYGELRKNTRALYEDDESFIFCRAGTRLLYITPNGNLYPCAMCTEGKEMLAGNVREKSLKSIWSDPESFKMFRNLDINKVEKCKDCQRKIECGGGLRCLALSQYSKVDSMDPFCVF